MKKTYIIPEMTAVVMHGEQMLAVSGVTGKIGDTAGPGYGGVDDNGELDPEVKENTFDFEWE